MPTNKEDTNLEFYRGDTENHKFVLRNSAGAPYDLEGFTIRCQARLSPDSDETLFDIEIEDGENENDFEDGILYLIVPASTTADLPPVCRYDIQASSGSLTITVAKGSINTLGDITR